MSFTITLSPTLNFEFSEINIYNPSFPYYNHHGGVHMNFNNIFEYKIKIFKTLAYIQIYEMYHKPTRFTPRNSTLEYIKFKDTYYRCQVYYSLVPRFTLRYKTHNYKIQNKNIISLGRTECHAFLQDYISLILKYKIQPDSTEDGSSRFKGTPYPVSLETAEQIKLNTLANFQKSLCRQLSWN